MNKLFSLFCFSFVMGAWYEAMPLFVFWGLVIYDIEKWKKSVYNIGVYYFNLEDADGSASVRFPFLP